MDVHLTIDFFDDLVLSEGEWSEAALREMVREVARRGITTIHWIDHGRLDGGFWETGMYLDKYGASQRLAATVPDPLRVVCDEAHAIGLRILAVIKPWDFAFRLLRNPESPAETYESVRLPEVGGTNSPARFIRENPHVRSRLHPSLLPAAMEAELPIQTIRLWHGEADLPEVGQVALHVSYDNIRYVPYDGPMRVSQSVRRRKPPRFAPAPEFAFDSEGDFACIELAELKVDAPFVCVQVEGPTGIRNNLTAMLEVLGPEGQPLVYTLGMVPRRDDDLKADWENVGISFDAINGSPITRTHAGRSESAGRFHVAFDELQLLAFGRGRNESLFSCVEYAYPEVQQGLLTIIDEALDSGVDGVDIRQSTHCESLDWENYGFNEPMIEAFREASGVDVLTQPFDRAAWRDLRGRFLDEFLERASRHVRARQAMFSVHLYELMSLPNDQPTWLNMGWHWRDWLTSGMVDVVNFKTGDENEPFYREALAICREQQLPVIFSRKPTKARQLEDFTRYFKVARADGFDAINLYELAVFARLQPDGKLAFLDERLWQLVRDCVGTEGA